MELPFCSPVAFPYAIKLAASRSRDWEWTLHFSNDIPLSLLPAEKRKKEGYFPKSPTVDSAYPRPVPAVPVASYRAEREDS